MAIDGPITYNHRSVGTPHNCVLMLRGVMWSFMVLSLSRFDIWALVSQMYFDIFSTENVYISLAIFETQKTK